MLLRDMNITPRRLEVLKIMYGGTTDAECGEILYIASATVRNHIAQLLTITGFKSRKKMLAWARSSGISKLDVAVYENWLRTSTNGLPPSNSKIEATFCPSDRSHSV